MYISQHNPVIRSYLCTMKKSIVIIMLCMIWAGVLGQTWDYERIPAEGVSKILDKKMKEYVQNFDHSLERSVFLDYFANERSNYFLSVLEETSETRRSSLGRIFNQLPAGDSSALCHNELFGKSKYFIEPPTPYVTFTKKLDEINVLVNNEILQLHYWTKKFKYQVDVNTIGNIAIQELSDLTPSGILGVAILENYKASKPHHRTIKTHGNGKYGISTSVLITEKKISENEWKYEAILINLVVFSKQLDNK